MIAQLAEPTGGGGGFLEIGGTAIFLSPVQVDLLGVLLARATAEQDRPASVRGYVRSTELLSSPISWATSEPDSNHLKQLVRRLRRKLTAAGVALRIEARQSLGYRLVAQETR